MRWVANLTPGDLGEESLLEMRKKTLVLGYSC